MANFRSWLRQKVGGAATVPWEVLRDGDVIDTVFYSPQSDAEYVKSSLIDHDHYPSDISVRKKADGLRPNPLPTQGPTPGHKGHQGRKVGPTSYVCDTCGEDIRSYANPFGTEKDSELDKVGDEAEAGYASLDRIGKFRWIVDNHQYNKIDGQIIDGFTASAAVQVYDALNPQNQQKFMNLPLPQMVDVAFSLIEKSREPQKQAHCGHCAEAEGDAHKIHCPRCHAEIWDKAFASKLHKCWNCGLAFDQESVEVTAAAAPACPVCGGQGTELGQLGRRKHYRCRNCGIDFSHDAETTPEEQAEV